MEAMSEAMCESPRVLGGVWGISWEVVADRACALQAALSQAGCGPQGVHAALDRTGDLAAGSVSGRGVGGAALLAPLCVGSLQALPLGALGAYLGHRASRPLSGARAVAGILVLPFGPALAAVSFDAGFRLIAWSGRLG